ncbi:MAG: M3 family oligoendopeptidase [Proteobacteria bacterium]|nr:M3 family oligoendopeptidase [Pseudomonadota bacterium]
MSKQLNKELGTEGVLWNLNDLYDGLDDELICDDIDLCEQEAGLLKEFAGKLAELEPAQFARVVRRLERIAANLGRVATYAYLNFATQVTSAEAGAFLQKVKEAASRISRDTVFFDLEWSKMEQDVANHFLEAEDTAPYHHYLYSVRRYADHLLSKVEETLLIEFSPVAASSWTSLFTKVMGHLKFGDKQRGQEEVLADLYSPEREVRRQAAQDMTMGLKSQLHVFAHIFNTLLADKMIDDRLRSYPSWVSSRNLSNELEKETVEALVEATTSRYDIVKRYYGLKKRLLGLDELHDYDRYAPLPSLPDKKLSWQECREMVLAGFAEFSPKMAEIAELFFEQNWIHAPVVEGKQGGAFAHPCVPDVHPYVMVNYTGNLRDVSTVAHELGHGIHQYLARDKGYFNANTPLVLAETASVFAELLIFHKQLDLLDDPAQRRAFICQKLESIFATVFRQISMNRFEDMIHNSRRHDGELSSDKLSAYWLESQRAMFGDSVHLSDDYGIWWSYIPHFLRTPGYVYAYAFGELLVLALYKLYQEQGAEFVPTYLELLSQGGSQSPYDLLKPFGIDLSDPAFWQGGLAVIDEMLQQVEG